jgi:hypothetical protein
LAAEVVEAERVQVFLRVNVRADVGPSKIRMSSRAELPIQRYRRRQPDPNQIPPLEMRPRVVLRFAPEKELFVSGMLTGGSELTGKAAVVDVPVGRGHVVMFANNPMWRHETHGSFSMLFNAILNYDNLGVGRSEPKPTASPSPSPSPKPEEQ